MSDTPRTDQQINGEPCTRFAILAGDSLRNASVSSDFARQLERELTAANDRIKRLEDVGKNLRECAGWLGYAASQYGNNILRAEAAIKAWDKEARP